MVLNISEHLTRSKYRQEPGNAGYRVIGCILGKQVGRTLEICNSVETIFSHNDKSDPNVTSITIDERYFESRINDYLKMFPELQAVGWYSVKGTTTPAP